MVAATVVAPSRRLRQHIGQVAPADLHGVGRGAQQFQLVVRQADADLAADDGDGGRHGAGVADQLFDFARHLHVLRIRHAVRDDGRLERDDRFAGGSRGCHFGRKQQELVHGHPGIGR
jgi:hypothetical protein